MMRNVLLATAAIALLSAVAPAANAQSSLTVDQIIGKLRGPNLNVTPSKAGRGLGTPIAETSAAAPRRPAAVQSAAVMPPASQPTMTDASARPSLDMNITFATGSATLTPGAINDLRKLGMALTSPDLRDARFLIEGHTDTVGDRAMNQMLSEQRATAVVEFLTREFAIPATRLPSAGKGEDDLLVPTADETANAANRRVHIVNLGS